MFTGGVSGLGGLFPGGGVPAPRWVPAPGGVPAHGGSAPRGGACSQGVPAGAPPRWLLLWAVHILLECILVLITSISECWGIRLILDSLICMRPIRFLLEGHSHTPQCPGSR